MIKVESFRVNNLISLIQMTVILSIDITHA